MEALANILVFHGLTHGGVLIEAEGAHPPKQPMEMENGSAGSHNRVVQLVAQEKERERDESEWADDAACVGGRALQECV